PHCGPHGGRARAARDTIIVGGSHRQRCAAAAYRSGAFGTDGRGQRDLALGLARLTALGRNTVRRTAWRAVDAGEAARHRIRPSHPGGCLAPPAVSRANRRLALGVVARANAIPAASACNRNSWSRSHTTSMWSATNPMGQKTTALVPAAASAARWSPTSGSSHGTL